MLAKNVYNVQKLNNSDGWVLLCKKVFGDYCEEEEMLDLKEIGNQIVSKCDGLPLAIEVIGGVLRTKDSNKRSEWEKILRSNTWLMDHGELRGALYLSYEDLPVHLKQCFLYCSLYPEDFNIRRGELVRYWVAEGFITSSDGGDAGILMEDIADDYYLELVRRSLLQHSGKDFYRMHDMLRSLAQSLIGDENICLAGHDTKTALNATNTTLRKLRRLSLVITKEAVMPNFDTMTEHLKHLRTFLLYGGNYLSTLAMNNHHLFEVLDHLRVLNLVDMNIESLPDSLGNLIHLRHLVLDRSRISDLPNSIQNLVNLQNLSLEKCRNLHTLPKGITQLYNLRYFNIFLTPLICMPKGLCRMKQLNHLVGYSAGDEFMVGQSEECNMDELQNLSQMRVLSIENMRRATTGTPAITNKPHLKEMSLDFNLNSTGPYGDADIQRIEKVLEELFPPSSIQLLRVYDYPGRGNPSWISTPSLITSFPLLETIELSMCTSLTQLPPLGQLPQLKFLKISKANAIVNVGPEFAWGHGGSVQSAFPWLEKLEFKIMPNWEEWTLSGDDERSGGETSKLIFPRLKGLVLDYCPRLRSLPAGLSLANRLESMTLYRLNAITEVNPPPRLSHLEVFGMRCLERISHPPLLRDLQISICPNLKDVEHLDALCSLDLKITGSEEDLPAWLLELAAANGRQIMSEAHSSSSSPALPVPDELFQLRLSCGPALLRRCLECGEYWPIIQQFPKVTINSYYSDESLAFTRTPRTYKAHLTD